MPMLALCFPPANWTVPDYTYSQAWCLDRQKMIRSPEGYAGLKNLSNTCYLNSLLTQLFMNVGFRGFMLQLNVNDPEASQKLLDETKKLFGYMQETWLKSVDPQGLVDTIRTYDNEPIDVAIQMDVDEFYNLLFDRWEAQVLDSEEKKKFRSFYGGQLVQQIKSKECTHISERLEPFSAIQCDIKGKASLEESLQAYVEGEIMQGGELAHGPEDFETVRANNCLKIINIRVRRAGVMSMRLRGKKPAVLAMVLLLTLCFQSLFERCPRQPHFPPKTFRFRYGYDDAE